MTTTTTTNRRRFARNGKLAINPAALAEEFTPWGGEPVRMNGLDAVVPISGPLSQQNEGWWDNYPLIRERVSLALSAPSSRVVLEINSPGGDVFGLFELCRDLRALADGSRKPLIAYVNGMACSAAYALACACDEIVAPATAMVGSIGVIDALVDWTKQNEMMGVHVEVIASGARKADGVPDVAITSEAIAERKRQVDELAAVFFAWVAERRGMKPEAVAALNGAVFVGESARSVDLVDRTVDSLITVLVEQPRTARPGVQAGGGLTAEQRAICAETGCDPKVFEQLKNGRRFAPRARVQRRMK